MDALCTNRRRAIGKSEPDHQRTASVWKGAGYGCGVEGQNLVNMSCHIGG